MQTALPFLAASAAAGLHLAVLVSSGELVTLRGAVAIELLAAASLLVFVAVRRSAKPERKIASVCIFVSSLVLALSAPAALLLPAAARGEFWAGTFSAVPWPAIALWSLSLLGGGLAMHWLTNQRWQRATRSG